MTGQNTTEKGASGVPLAQILRAVVPVLSGLRNQTTATESLARVDGALRPAAQAICYAVLRQWGQSLALRRRLAPRAPAPDVDALLRAALEDHRARGFRRCAVDFESFNPEAAAFWPRFFQPVCYSLMRIPERALPF